MHYCLEDFFNYFILLSILISNCSFLVPEYSFFYSRFLCFIVSFLIQMVSVIEFILKFSSLCIVFVLDYGLKQIFLVSL